MKIKYSFLAKISVLVIFTTFISCSDQTKNGIKKKIKTEKEIIQMRKKNRIIGEKKIRIAQRAEYGIVKTDSVLLEEKKYNSDGLLIFKKELTYNLKNGNISCLAYSDYDIKGIIKYKYDSTFHFEGEGANIVIIVGERQIPINFVVYKTDFDEKGKEKISITDAAAIKETTPEIELKKYLKRKETKQNSIITDEYQHYISKSDYKWINDSTYEYTYYNSSGKLEGLTRSTFDSQKHLLAEIDILNNKNKLLQKWEYDKNGNIIKRFDSEDSWEIFRYNGQFLIEKQYYLDGILADRSTYQYNNLGNQIKSIHYNKDGTFDAEETKYQYDASGNILSKISPSGTFYNYSYDNSGNNIQMIVKDELGKLKYARSYKYNTLNNIVEETQYGPGEKLEAKIIYVYEIN